MKTVKRMHQKNAALKHSLVNTSLDFVIVFEDFTRKLLMRCRV